MKAPMRKTGSATQYLDAGKGGLPGSPIHHVLVSTKLAQSLWGGDDLPGASTLAAFHGRIAEGVARSAGFPHEPALLTFPGHGSHSEVRCILRYKTLGHMAGLCLDPEN